MLVGLVQSAALLLALSLLYGFSLRLGRFRSQAAPLAAGLFFGAICIVGMLMPIEIEAGVIFDPRTVVLSMAGLFGGPVVALVAGALAGGFRLYLGGPGASVGVATIVAAVLLGLAYRHARERGWVGVGFFPLLAFGLVLHLVAVGLFTQLPSDIAERVLRDLGLPFLLVFSVATAFLGLLLRDVESRFATEEDLRIAATAFEADEGMLVTDADGRALRVNSGYTSLTGYTADEVLGQVPTMFDTGDRRDGALADVRERVRTQGSWAGEVRCRRHDGTLVPVWLRMAPVTDAAGEVTHYLLRLSDITQQKALEHRVSHLALHDVLTNLPNRSLLDDRLKHALTVSARSDLHGALLMIDIDNFKALNETHGHRSGDLLLIETARRLGSCVRRSDTVARVGGDDFVVVIESLPPDPAEAAQHTERIGDAILASLNTAFHLDGHVYRTSCSIGATLFRAGEPGVADLLRQAELAMYDAKTAGRDTLRFFDPEMQASVELRAGLEQDLRVALQRNELEVHYHVQVDGDGRPVGYEALLRWFHPERGSIPPDRFIPLAEVTGLILPLGRFVLDTVCRQLADWSTDPDRAVLPISVNASARELRSPDFVDRVRAVLAETGADPHSLQIEITESMLLHDIEATIEKMYALREIGVQFSLDDFGTGYSSLAYLKQLPLTYLKIDRSFVRELEIDPNDAAIARSIILLADSLGLQVIAEGVETTAQQKKLADFGCRLFQGYLFGRPVSADQLPMVSMAT